VHPDDLPAIRQAVLKAHDPGGDGKFDVIHRIITRDGQVRWMDTRSQTFFAGEGGERRPVRTVGATIDITEQKYSEEAMRQTEEQLAQSQKLQALGQLVGGVAHDFNNLLTVIAGNAQLLAHTVKGQPATLDAIRLIDEAATRAAHLTRQLLAFARRQQLSVARIDLNQVVKGAESLLKRTLGEMISVRLTTAPALWPVVADRPQLESALLNLAINARDAMPHGGTLTVETENVTLDAAYAAAHPDVFPGQYVRVSVRDTGTGIAPEVLPRVFDPFFTTKGTQGTGLGLSMVYGFVKQSGGHVNISSELGQGTCVQVYLPRASPAEDRTEQSAASSDVPRGK
ncbi:MAG TPA: ATP-binding protein, partial [bacterium]|nr:ATP-binding protein [bacterium]